MATGRNRPRKDEPAAAAHEEKDLWSKIVGDLKDLNKQSKYNAELSDNIASMQASLDEGSQSVCSLR